MADDWLTATDEPEPGGNDDWLTATEDASAEPDGGGNDGGESDWLTGASAVVSCPCRRPLGNGTFPKCPPLPLCSTWLLRKYTREKSEGQNVVSIVDDDRAATLPQLKFTGAKVLYGSPCGLAVPLEETYWCEDSQLVIGEQVRSLSSALIPVLNLPFSLNGVPQPALTSEFACSVHNQGAGFVLVTGLPPHLRCRASRNVPEQVRPVLDPLTSVPWNDSAATFCYQVVE